MWGCSAPDPEWASINLGILLCLKCSGAHRALGVQYLQIVTKWVILRALFQLNSPFRVVRKVAVGHVCSKPTCRLILHKVSALVSSHTPAHLFSHLPTGSHSCSHIPSSIAILAVPGPQVNHSKVRSVTLDTWPDDVRVAMLDVGNARANAYFEALLVLHTPPDRAIGCFALPLFPLVSGGRLQCTI